MITDISACNGCIGETGDALQYCPLRDDCLRYYLFKQWNSKSTRTGWIWQVVAEYENGKCKLQIEMNNE